MEIPYPIQDDSPIRWGKVSQIATPKLILGCCATTSVKHYKWYQNSYLVVVLILVVEVIDGVKAYFWHKTCLYSIGVLGLMVDITNSIRVYTLPACWQMLSSNLTSPEC